MKKLINIMRITLVLAAACCLSACDDMLNTESNRILFTEDNTLQSQNDSPYSLVGILSQLRKLGDRYVILGELRGEMMDISNNADMNLQQINNHAVTAQNPYANKKDYYAVINNCNYFLQHADTSLLTSGVRILHREYVAIKAIRAWTYFQLALNYGEAIYLDQPVLTLEDMQKDHPVYSLDQLIDVLIADLLPYVDAEMPSITIDSRAYIPVGFLLGDLYLWKGRYEAAAMEYYNLMYKNEYTVGNYRSTWPNETFLGRPNTSWTSILYSSDVISHINYFQEVDESALPYLVIPVIPNQNTEYKLIVSDAAKKMWDSEIYTYYNSTTRLVSNTNGDLRGAYGSYDFALIDGDSIPYIQKYSSIPGRVFLYRTTTLYLRYAEAVNRLGKPSLAFAVMKYGLNRNNMGLGYIRPEEITPLPHYCNFSDSRFSSNIAVRAHGLGNTERDTVYYVFPKLATMQDSIVYAEDLICNELALETAFEGNRFHDLMRFAIRRNDPDFLAGRVAKKNPALRAKLQNSGNWFLPKE